MCSHPMVQAAHEARATRRASLSPSPERASAPSKLPDWKLRVGRACSRLNVSRLATVPSSRYLAVAGPKERRDRSFAAALTTSGSATLTRREPATSTALSPLAPSTAPSPPRPAWRLPGLGVGERAAVSPPPASPAAGEGGTHPPATLAPGTGRP